MSNSQGIANGAYITGPNAGSNLVLPSPTPGVVSTLELHLIDNGPQGFIGSVKIVGQGITVPLASNWEQVPYLAQYLNGSIVTPPQYTAAAITTTSILAIPSTGLLIALFVASCSQGQLQMFFTQNAGASA